MLMTPETIALLLVEDNPDDVALILRILKKTKAKVVVVRDGQEALDYLFFQGKYAEQKRGLPNVVFLDISLPKIKGLDVLKSLRANSTTEALPVVMFSSSDEPSDIAKAYALGANSYISKPVNFNEFSRYVDIMGQYWLGMNRVATCQLP